MCRLIILFNLTIFSFLSAREHLVLIENLAEPQKFHVIEQVQNRSIVIATDEEINRMQTEKCSYKVLDENPREKNYYLIFPSIKETRKDIEKTATILTEFQEGFLIQVSQENEHCLFDLKAEFNYLEFDRMVFETYIPPKLQNPQITYNPDIQEIVNSVSTDTLESFIRHLQEIPSRHVDYSYLEDEAVPWIVQKLEEYGCDSVYIQDVPNYNAPNVIGIKLGSLYPSYTKYYMIGGHPDCQPRQNPNYGADDNGTGTAAFLETARVFKDHTFDYTIVYMAFNAEEVGMRGSAHYAKGAYDRGDSVLSVLNMERCAHVKDEARLYLTRRQSMPSTTALADLFMECADTYSTNLVSSYNPVELTNSDHASFWNRGYTAIMAKEMDEPPVYHTVQDTLGHPNGANNLDFHTSVVKTGAATLAELAGLTPTSIKPNGIKGTKVAFSIQRLSGKQIILRTNMKPIHIKKIAIYNACGRIIKSLNIPQNSKNSSIFTWDSKNESGKYVPSGVYFIELRSIYGKYCTSFLML